MKYKKRTKIETQIRNNLLDALTLIQQIDNHLDTSDWSEAELRAEEARLTAIAKLLMDSVNHLDNRSVISGETKIPDPTASIEKVEPLKEKGNVHPVFQNILDKHFGSR